MKKETEVVDLTTGKTWETFEEYMTYMVNNGYITSDGKPLKCHKCNSEELGINNEYYGPVGIEEYDMICKKCRHVVGLWSYGYWQL